MGLIIPYNEQLISGRGAFIKPNNEIIYVTKDHETTAQIYTRGEEFSKLKSLKSKSDFEFAKFREETNFQGQKEDIDIYKTSKLTKDELILYKKWVNACKKEEIALIDEDFLVYVLGFDTLETIIGKFIKTTNPRGYRRYYNYLLNDFQVFCIPPKKYNEELEQFETVKTSEWQFLNDMEFKTLGDIEEVKQKILENNTSKRNYYR